MDIIFPPPLNFGDLIGVVSPASPLYGEKSNFLDRGLNHLLSKGYRLLEGEHLRDEYGYLAGTDKARANDFNRMIRNSHVKAIFCSRGGYGTMRILDKIDYSALRAHPKIIMGYSDITALQMAVFLKTGLVSFSGPMVAVEMGDNPNPLTENLWQDVMANARALKMDAEHFGDEKIVYRAGSAKGRLMGGCLSMLCSLIGTPYMPDFSESILVLEDIGESIYKIDRCFSQLAHAGILQKINGLVLGQFIDCQPKNGAPSLMLKDVVEHYTKNLAIPVLGNFPYGHDKARFTLPIGVQVKLDSSRGVIEMLEPAVREE